MSEKKKKISHLFHQDSFLQVNFIKGYKYIDKAGEIVNVFHNDNKVPAFNMDLNGLIIYKPTLDIEAVKVSSNIFWMHLISPGSLDQVENAFIANLKIIIKILEVNKLSRIGWRNYFMYDLNDESEAEQIMKKLSPTDGLSFQEGIFLQKIKDVNLKIRFKKVYKNNESKTPALLFDVDGYLSNEQGINRDAIKAKLSDIKGALKSSNLLDTLNKLSK